MLTEGIKGNEELLRERGIQIEPEKLAALSKALEEAGARQDEAKLALDQCRKDAHARLEALKEHFNDAKQPIKLAFLPEEWSNFGLADKR